MLGVKEERIRLAVAPLRLPAALLASAVLATTAPAVADAATGHGSGVNIFTATGAAATATGAVTSPTATSSGSSTTPSGTSTSPTVAATTVTPTGTVKGTVVAIDADSFTIQTRGTTAGVIDAMTTYATELGAQDYPYVWGGGHAQAEIASVGEPGPGSNGKRTGFDCSGAVAAVLTAGGLWPKGQAVPNDAGVIQSLLQRGLIARGPGTGPEEVTLYDDPGVHIFMNIDGRFFGTSDGNGGGGDAAGGPGWISDGASDALNPKVFKRYHVLPSALDDSPSYGHQVTFQYAGGITGAEEVAGLSLDANVRVSYAQASDGALDMGTVTYAGSSTVTGTVTNIATTGSQFTLRTSGGRSLTLYAPDTSLTHGLLVDESVTVTYSKQAATKSSAAGLVVHGLTVNSGATTATTPTTSTKPTSTKPTGVKTTPTATVPTTATTAPTAASTVPAATVPTSSTVPATTTSPAQTTTSVSYPSPTTTVITTTVVTTSTSGAVSAEPSVTPSGGGGF